MRSISCHIMPLIINSFRHGHTHARILTICTGSILRNQPRAGLRLARASFNKPEKWTLIGDLSSPHRASINDPCKKVRFAQMYFSFTICSMYSQPYVHHMYTTAYIMCMYFWLNVCAQWCTYVVHDY